MDILGFFLIALLVFAFTAIVAIAGIGAAFILIPFFFWMGYPFNIAATIGMFSNVISTSSQSYLHVKNKTINYNVALPMIITSGIFAILGVLISKSINEKILLMMFSNFLFIAGLFIFLRTIKKNDNADISFKSSNYLIIGLISGTIIGFISGMLGVGGGSIILPLLLFIGMETKKAASTTSFVVLFSSITSFITRAILVQMDWTLLLVVGIFTLIGGFTGSRLMHYKLKQRHIKLVMIFILWVMGIKILLDLFL